MKRRKKKQENETEATGKVGQQKPLVDELHPGPIVPSYSDPEQEGCRRSRTSQTKWLLPRAEVSRVETEIQPESPELPGAAPTAGPVAGGQGSAAHPRVWWFWPSDCRVRAKPHGSAGAA